MKYMFKTSGVASALALAGMFAFSGLAPADTVTAKFVNMTQTDSISYKVLLPPGSTPGTTKQGTTTAGIFNFSQGSGPIDFFGAANDQFVSFCIDLADPITAGSTHTWDVVELSDAPDPIAGPMNVDKAEDIAQVLTWALSNSVNHASINSGLLNDARFLSAAEKQATQAVIWEIVHEAPNNAYGFQTGTALFSGLTTDASLFASKILAGYETASAMDGLVGLTIRDVQDFVGQVPPVPIPAAGWLFGSAVIGAVALGRPKKKAEQKA